MGKIYSVCRFGEMHFDIFLKLDLERDCTIHRIFERDLPTEKLILDLEVHQTNESYSGKHCCLLMKSRSVKGHY